MRDLQLKELKPAQEAILKATATKNGAHSTLLHSQLVNFTLGKTQTIPSNKRPHEKMKTFPFSKVIESQSEALETLWGAKARKGPGRFMPC